MYLPITNSTTIYNILSLALRRYIFLSTVSHFQAIKIYNIKIKISKFWAC
jgi:hypothetical protein